MTESEPYTQWRAIQVFQIEIYIYNVLCMHACACTVPICVCICVFVSVSVAMPVYIYLSMEMCVSRRAGKIFVVYAKRASKQTTDTAKHATTFHKLNA